MPEVAIITFVPAEGLSKELNDYLKPQPDGGVAVGPFVGTEYLDPLTEACLWGDQMMSRLARDGEWEATIVSIPDYLFDSSNLRDWSEPPANDPTDPRGN